ncbi:M36 family metallopeptidase [Egicoccus sp. AB-alg2]|uniref:M36 family metallopeptidase n=1 Tax=Egicoccus sp. AB-alg2 TaxID=3242693 RepID=UPI00359EE310
MERTHSRLAAVTVTAAMVALLVPVASGTEAAAQSTVPASGFLTGPNDGAPEDIATSYFREEAATYGLSSSDVADLAVRSSYVSRHNGVTHVNLNQRYEGLEVFGADTTVNIAADGSVVFVGGASVSGLAAAPTDADLTAADAVEAAAEALDLDEPEDLRTLRRRTGPARETVLSDGGISDEPIPARLGWQPTDKGLRLAWQLVIDDASDVHLWNATVDAKTGELLDVDDWTSHDHEDDLTATLSRAGGPSSSASSALAALAPPSRVEDGSSYRVFAFPAETPNDAPTTLVTEPADAEASPFGWHDTDGAHGAEHTTTRGNNVHAYFDQDANNQPDPGFDLDGGAGLTFDHEPDLHEHAQNYRESALTNLFYWNNLFHDLAWRYGFDEASGNFQQNKYGATQANGNPVPGGDHVRAEAADGGGTNNANFSTPANYGGTPRMQMFLWPGNQFGSQNQIIVDGVGEFGAGWARFAPAPTAAGLSDREIVYAGTGCSAGLYPTELPAGPWMAIVDGGTTGGLCTNPIRAQVAQSLGADALVVAHNTTAAAPILTGAITLPRVEIPVVSITQADGNTIKAAVADGSTTGAVRKHPDHPGIRDGDLEAGIIIHEYGHGVSNRLTGGPGINCLSGNEQAGEGWSDYLAIALLIDPELDDPEGPRGMGPYALFQDSREGNGIRPRPYSRNWDIQPFSYDSIKTGGWLNGTSLALPHGLGHGWAAVLWDMTWDLIDKHGFNPNVYEDWSTGGNNLAYQLVMDGMKFQGCGPGLVVARDAIIAADAALTGGDNACTLWASFARRGLGYSAVQGTTNRNDNDEAFDTHPACQNGFQSPVRAGAGQLNTVGAGSTVPMRFDLGANRGKDVLATNSPYSRQVDCDTLAVVSQDPNFTTPRAAPVAADSPGNASLSVTNRGIYSFNWKTAEGWVDTCREFVLTRDDGQQHRAFFRFVEAD